MINLLIRLDDGTWVDPADIRAVAAYPKSDEWPDHVRVVMTRMVIHINYETFRKAETARNVIANEANRVRGGKT